MSCPCSTHTTALPPFALIHFPWAVISWELAEVHVLNVVLPACSAPWGRARAGGHLSWHKVTTHRAVHALAVHWLTVLPAAPPARGLLALGASTPARHRDLLEEASLLVGTASPEQAVYSPGLPEPGGSLLTAPPLAGHEVVFFRAAVPLGIS